MDMIKFHESFYFFFFSGNSDGEYKYMSLSNNQGYQDIKQKGV